MLINISNDTPLIINTKELSHIATLFNEGEKDPYRIHFYFKNKVAVERKYATEEETLFEFNKITAKLKIKTL